MTAAELVKELEPLGTPSYKKVLLNHGVQEPVLGVKIADLKLLQKRIKKDYPLALELYDTGIYDAQYLAGLVADETRMTEADLRRWLATANCGVVCGTIVAWVAAESRDGRKLALDWIESADENITQAGWWTLTGLVSIKADADLDLAELEHVLQRIEQTIHQQPDRVRYAMNGCLIAMGTHVRALTELAVRAGEKIGPVPVDRGNTACEVPYAPAYIRKAETRGTLGKKRRSARC